MCRGDRAVAAERTDFTSYSGEHMGQVGEWKLEQNVLAPSLSRVSENGPALLLQAGCFVRAAHGRGCYAWGILQAWCCFKAVLCRGARHWNGICWLVGVT